MAASFAPRTVLEVWPTLRARIGRHRRGALAIAWGVCLIGWLGVALLPNPYRSTALLGAIDPEAHAAFVVARQHLLEAGRLVGAPAGPDDRIPDAWLEQVGRQLTVGRAPGARFTVSITDDDPVAAQRVLAAILAATLGEGRPQPPDQRAADLAAARALRADYARRLAQTPSAIRSDGAGPGTANPMYARLEAQLAQQDALISSLEQRADGVRPRTDPDARFRIVAPPSVPARVRPWTGALLALVFCAAVGSGGAWAVDRGARDQVFDSPRELERRLGQPVLGSLPALPALTVPDRWSDAGALVVGLGLLTAFAGVMALETIGWLAVFGTAPPLLLAG